MISNYIRYSSASLILIIFFLSGCQEKNLDQFLSENSQDSLLLSNGWHDKGKSSDSNEVRVFELDEETFRENLDAFILKKSLGQESLDQLSIPLPDDSEIMVSVETDELVAEDYKQELPDAKTWKVSSTDNRIFGGAINFNAFGYNIMLLMTDGSITYIEPKNEKNSRHYLSYSDKHEDHAGVNCGLEHDQGSHTKNFSERLVSTLNNDRKRIYRFAPVATTAFHRRFGWLNGRNHVVHTWNHMHTLLSRARIIIRRDLAVDFRLVGSANSQVITDRNDDISLIPISDNQGNITGYNHRGASTDTLDQNQAFLNRVLGNPNYDIGHVFDDDGTGLGGGLAYTRSVCRNDIKAGGYSNWNGSNNNFAISLLAHEVGHQLGAFHTYSSPLCVAPGFNINTASAVEPGSGTTIMGYPDVCTGDNVASSDRLISAERMFHSRSIEDVHNWVHRGGGSSCGIQAEPNGNPLVDLDPLRENRLVIPSRTPFILDGVTVQDPNRQRTWYSWEQVLPFPTSRASRLNTDNGDNGLIRTNLPTWTTKRIIPSLEALTSGRRIDGEVVPLRSRAQLRFRFVARDNTGGVGYDDVNIRVHNTGRPFRVLQPNTTQIRTGPLTVQWDVANTNVAPISCANVEIAASQNNGRIFTPLVAETANDGVATVNIPGWLATNQTRIRVKCSSDIFFAMSATNPGTYTAQ